LNLGTTLGFPNKKVFPGSMCLGQARVTPKEHLHPRMGALVNAVRNMFLVTTPVFAQAAIQEPGALAFPQPTS
jgi:hypothetical protein